VGEHTVGKFVAKLQQARSVRRPRQRPACPDRLPAREKYRREAVKLDPKGVLAARPRIELRGDGRGNAELGWANFSRRRRRSSFSASVLRFAGERVTAQD
jgi:hypothetical protein